MKRQRLLGLVFAAVAYFAYAPGVRAQGLCGTATPVLSPSGSSVTASADHNTVNTLDGSFLVAKYVVRVKRCSDNFEVKAIDLGKPTPDAANVLKTTLTATDYPVNTKLYLTWEAVAPSGLAGVSGPSVPFGWKGPDKAPAPPGPTPSIQ